MEWIARGADAIRRALWRTGARTAIGRACLRDRAVRVAALASLHILIALVLGHLHNVVALGLWLAMMRDVPRAGRRLNGSPFRKTGIQLVIVLYAACIAILSTGVGERIASSAPAAGLSVDDLVLALAPDLPVKLALQLVSIFAFAQAVHYALWVRVIPETRLGGPLAPSFRRSLAAMRGALGRIGVLVAVTCAVLLPVVALV